MKEINALSLDGDILRTYFTEHNLGNIVWIMGLLE